MAAELARRGRPVIVASRSINPWLAAFARTTPAIRCLRTTVDADGPLADLVAEAACVYLMAGSSTPALAARDVAGAAAETVATTVTVLDLMRRAGTARGVLASSGGTVYGEPATLPVDEAHPLNPISAHGVNALAAEAYAHFYADHHGLDLSVLRFANVYGPGQTGRRGQGVIAAWCRALAVGEAVPVLGSLRARRDFVYAADAARAAVAIGEHPDATGIYNVGSGEAVALSHVLELVAEAAGRAPHVEALPGRDIDVSAVALDHGRLTAATGWRPQTPLAAGIGAAWSWVLDREAAAGEPLAALDSVPSPRS